MPDFPITLTTTADDAGQRLDQYLAAKLAEVSRARVQQLIARGEVLVNGTSAKASLRLGGGEQVTVSGPPQSPALRAMAEETAAHSSTHCCIASVLSPARAVNCARALSIAWIARPAD
jgi:23S rRNA-/tRNA-specific pseudouridylate synthase